MTDILTAPLFWPGTKFRVSDDPKDSSFPPGTIGFLANSIGGGGSYRHVEQASVVIIRKGKKGKDRLDINHISMPTFILPEKIQLSKDIRETLPIGNKFYVHIELVPVVDNVLDMTNMEFLGWATAYGQYILLITGYSSHGFTWPEKKSHPLNIITHLSNKWANSPPDTIDSFTSPYMRVDLVNEIRRTEAALVKCVMDYNSQTALNASRAAKYIRDIITEYKIKDIEKSEIKETEDYYRSMQGYIAIQSRKRKNA